jgi:tRNA threonylcarbamoyladenosine biosynthesis protein TsaB
MSYILGLDTSSEELGIALASDQKVLLSFSRYLRNSHAEHIDKSVEFLLAACAVASRDITRVAVATGPGSFTGLRIGISFIKGFCFDRDVRVLPVSSLESMARAWNGREKPVIAALDARNGDVFWARFEPRGEELMRMANDALTSLEQFEASIDRECTVITDALGNAKSRSFDFLKQRPGAYSIERFPIQRGLGCALSAISAVSDPLKWVSPAELVPKYLTITTMEKKLQELSR